MADNNMNKNSNETLRNEQGGAGATERKPEHGGMDKNRQESGTDKDRGEKSAIGGQSGQKPTGQAGEPGRVRSELDQKNSEPTSR